ncbi:unnamed protein product [Diatraea saccharalis]|uniref:Uncharacterized protein n=1 Tax=Diatraea saccharalis TaxID=40085 RepID=A0A9N9RA50_9NEOP|nr:unnamed protein product [Diatraea saccharalis]
MSGGSGGGGSGGGGAGGLGGGLCVPDLDSRRPSTCRVELGSLLAPEPRPLDNKVKIVVPGRAVDGGGSRPTSIMSGGACGWRGRGGRARRRHGAAAALQPPRRPRPYHAAL